MPKHARTRLEHSQAIASRTQRERLAAPDRAQPLTPGAILQRTALAPQSLRPAEIMRLQQTLGNRAVAQMLSSLVQAKLTVNTPGDEYEQEADRVAEEVMQKPAVQRAELEGEEDDDQTPEVMTKPQPSPLAGGAFAAGDAFEQQLRAGRGQGQPLPPALRGEFETKFGADFGRVRVHADAQSDQLNRSIQAKAFTTGLDVFFRQGLYEPGSKAGQVLLAHELTHVMQQSGGIPTSGIIQRDVGFEFETDWGIHPSRDETDVSKDPLEKHTSYRDYDGFQLQVDEASRGFKSDYSGVKREIEFVVEQHPETKEGGEKLHRTMTNLEKAVEELQGEGTTYPGGFDLPDSKQDGIWVFPKAKDSAKPGEMHARPQATVGLTLAAIHKYGTVAAEELTNDYVKRKHTLGSIESGQFESAAKKVEGVKESASQELRGLLTLLAYYIWRFYDPGAKDDYAKGTMPILAKTNFAEMFNHLDAKERKKYQKNPSKFVDLALKSIPMVVGKPKFKKDDPVIPPKRIKNIESKAAVLNLTLGEWLRNIPKGKDLLTEQYYKEELFGFGNLKQKGEATGEKVDWVLQNGEKVAAMVLEFRAGVANITGQGTGFLSPSKWRDFAFDYFQLVRQLHGSEATPEEEESSLV